ncbi:hypothetical protein [Pelotalea chapellei]|uniref:Uncharacterized protein n=1 Tax=Pelotalea chapellei TaxID=44671 RepID=A0ABS5U9Q8_9BACT|nr:hypothetical protein [Pelotalea chapellei]MBT1072412.1 hypothetical protein [Pelotalea chapellei]
MTDIPIHMKRLFSGFIAGFLATMVFHQLTLEVLWKLGIAPSAPFSMVPTQPFMIPATLSLAFWGGIWGILFVLVERKFPQGGGYWPAAFLFGAILPSIVALLIVLPLKGRPMGGGWKPSFLLTVFVVNGAWGVGTGLLARVLPPRR